MGGDRIPGPFNDAVDDADRWRKGIRKRHLGRIREGEGIQGALDRAQAAYISEMGRLDDIALDVYHGRRGGFLIKCVDAWLHADVWNKRLMRPVFEAFILKYNLEADPKGTGASEPPQTP